MKTFGVIGTMLTVTCGLLTAQVSVGIRLDQEQFLQDESLPLKVEIVNRSGQTLSLGDSPDWLTFHVQSREGALITRLGQVPVEGAFTLEASRMATREVNIMPYFDLPPGRYFVSATVKIPEWDREVESSRKIIEIVQGITIWEQVVGVPQKEGAPMALKYALQQAHYLSQPYLYARLTDPSDLKVLRVIPVGRLLSFSRPEAQIDRSSHLHVLFQTGARSFTYVVISTDGRMVKRERHDYTQSRPALKSSPEGDIAVAGGIRRLTRHDIPALQETTPNDNASIPAP